MRVPHAGHRITSVLVGILLAGTALAAPSVAAGHHTGTAGSPAQTAEAAAPAAEPEGQVVSRTALHVREEPNTRSRVLGSLPPGAVIRLHCKVVGENVDGNNRWYLLGSGRPGYVSARYVRNLSTVPWCA
ncbi:SH3 domain-containing protein [Streptomyces sp. NPDC001787]|uniref:SH3 domain-containing protein n=1 Tax=Streptomyces sp. NPDC001787 TaxID=3154523 RepID=UPI00332B282E